MSCSANVEPTTPPQASSVKAPLPRIELILVIIMPIIYAFSFFQRIAVPGTIFDELQHDFLLSPASVTLLGGIYLYIYGSMQLPAGALVDRFGGVRVIIAAGILLSLGSILFPLSHSKATLYASRTLIGFGASLIYLCVIKEIDARFSERRFPMILALVLLAGYFGGLTATFPFERAVSAFGWRGSMLGIGIGCSVVVLCMIILSRFTAASKSANASNVLSALVSIIRNKHSYPVLGAGLTIFGSYFVVQGVIGKKLLQDCCSLSSSTAAGVTFIMMLMAIICNLIVGRLPKFTGYRRRPIQISASLLAVFASAMALASLTFGANKIYFFASFVLLGVAQSGNVLYTCTIKELNPPQSVASSVGVLNSCIYLSIGVLTTIVGAILSRFAPSSNATHYPIAAYQSIMLLILGLSIVSVVCSVLVRETYGRNTWHDLAN